MAKKAEAIPPAPSGPTGLTGHMFHALKGLRGSWDRQMEMRPGEERLLFYVMFACFIALVASLPGAFRAVQVASDAASLQGLILGRFMGTIIFAPLAFYAIAGLSHLLSAWGFGGKGSYPEARLALFWSLVLITPLMLAYAALTHWLHLSGRAHLVSLPGAVLFAVWIWVWLSFLSFAEGFSRLKTLAFAVALFLILWSIVEVLG